MFWPIIPLGLLQRSYLIDAEPFAQAAFELPLQPHRRLPLEPKPCEIRCGKRDRELIVSNIAHVEEVR